MASIGNITCTVKCKKSIWTLIKMYLLVKIAKKHSHIVFTYETKEKIK